MKSIFFSLLVAVCPLTLTGQSPTQKTPLPAHPNGPAGEEIQTEKIVAPGQSTSSSTSRANPSGHLEPEQVKVLTHKIWLTEFRLNDLLTQVHAEKWKMPPAARQSFDQSMESLHKAIVAEEDWRSQLDARPDSLYLGFQTYVAIGALLPRVDGLAHSVAQYENASFGAQYSQAANQFFDLQQVLEPHLAALLQSQDSLFLAAQANLASCQNELNFAEHDKQGRAVPMKNIPPAFKSRKRSTPATAAGGGAKQGSGKGAAAGQPAMNPPDKTQKK